jgi:transposase
MYMSRPIGTQAELERRRRLAVERVNRGERPTVVARILGVNRNSLFRWRQAAARGGVEALAAVPQHGPKPRLADAQMRELERLLRQGAAAHGWANGLWTTARVAELIRRHFGVTFHPDHVGRFLRQRLNWSPQKPRRRARERDEAEIEHWKAVTFPRIVRNTFERDAHLVFLDESGYQLTPCLRRTWAPRGQTPILDAWDRRDRISAISSITVSPRTHKLNLYFDLLPANKNVHAEDVVAYLRRLQETLPGPMTVIWDRHKIHSRSTVVKKHLAQHPDLIVEDFPGYTPELNPDEAVWGWSKNRSANLAADDTRRLSDHVAEQLIELKFRPDLLASFIKQTYLPLRL